jgi:hypothetical protein
VRSWWPSLLFLLVDERCGVRTETCLFTGYRATKVLCSLRRGVFLHLARFGDCGNFASAKVPVMVDVVAAPHLCKPRAAGACFDTWCWWPRNESAKPGAWGVPNLRMAHHHGMRFFFISFGFVLLGWSDSSVVCLGDHF